MSVFLSLEKLPPPVRSLVNRCPSNGSGVHRFIYHLAHKVKPHLRPHEAEEILTFSSANCGREVPTREVTETVRNVYHSAAPSRGSQPQGDTGRKKGARYSPLALQHALRAGVELNPTISPFESAAEACRLLFPARALICTGSTVQTMETTSLEEALPFVGRRQFVVPSPMSALKGVTQCGKASSRCLDNTGPRNHLVIEFDQHEFDVQKQILHFLSQFLQLRLITYSGSKSLHGWYACSGILEPELRVFMDRAIELGADHATWTPCQAVRMPNGIRNDQKIKNVKQQVIEFYG